MSPIKEQTKPFKAKVIPEPIKKIDLNKYQMLMMGITKKGPTILALTSNFSIEVLRTKYNFPRYAHALISPQNSNTGYLTGGV
jgi:hypothetical protein